MGIFSFIGKKMNETKERAEEAEKKGERMSITELINTIGRVTNFGESTGYLKALKNRAAGFSDSELIDAYEYAYKRNNTKAGSVLAQAMVDAGLGYKDENGRFHRDY